MVTSCFWDFDETACLVSDNNLDRLFLLKNICDNQKLETAAKAYRPLANHTPTLQAFQVVSQLNSFIFLMNSILSTFPRVSLEPSGVSADVSRREKEIRFGWVEEEEEAQLTLFTFCRVAFDSSRVWLSSVYIFSLSLCSSNN